MNLLDVLSKLSQARQLVSDKAINVLDRVAEISDLISKSAREASQWLKDFDGLTINAVEGESAEGEETPKQPKEGDDKPETKDKAAEIKEALPAFEKFQADMSDLAGRNVHQLRAMSRSHKDQMPASVQIGLIKTISCLTDNIVDSLHEREG